MNADFLAGCEAEIKALAARPDVAPGSYGGPLLITSYTPPESLLPDDEIVPAAEPAVENAEAAIAEPEPPIRPAAFEPTPENYPAAPVGPE